MSPSTLHHILVRDWAVLENTPPVERRPAELARWYGGVEDLAAMSGVTVQEMAERLRVEAEPLAARRRHEMLRELAQDLAVSRALAEELTPPWYRRLDRLAQVAGTPADQVLTHVTEAARNVRVTVGT